MRRDSVVLVVLFSFFLCKVGLGKALKDLSCENYCLATSVGHRKIYKPTRRVAFIVFEQSNLYTNNRLIRNESF